MTCNRWTRCWDEDDAPARLRACMKLLLAFGTRPEAIKMAPLALRLREDDRFDCRICVTGQHRHMLHQMLDLFGIEADYDLAVMREGQDLSGITSAILLGMKDVFAQFSPNLLLVHGDTATTLSASLAAYYHRIPVGHVEAGLRTHDLYAPWPEEGSRKLTGVLAALHFAPTESAAANLVSEGIDPDRIAVTGNTVVDALLQAVRRLESDPALAAQVDRELPVWDKGRPTIVVTGHRRESLGKGIDGICQALARIARDYPGVDIVYPVHPNPQVQQPVRGHLSGLPNVHLLEPLDYLPFVRLMDRAHIVLTDSGGIQEEAPALGKPVLVMREATERPEAVAAGTAMLVGPDPARILREAGRLMTDAGHYRRMSQAHNPYGDGAASERIAQALSRWAAQKALVREVQAV